MENGKGDEAGGLGAEGATGSPRRATDDAGWRDPRGKYGVCYTVFNAGWRWGCGEQQGCAGRGLVCSSNGNWLVSVVTEVLAGWHGSSVVRKTGWFFEQKAH